MNPAVSLSWSAALEMTGSVDLTGFLYQFSLLGQAAPRFRDLRILLT